MIQITLCPFLIFIIFRAKFTSSVAPIMLNVQSKDGFIGFTVGVEIASNTTSIGAQQLLVDTGSSAMVFCNKDLTRSKQDDILTYPGGSNVMYLGPPNDQCIGGPFLMADIYGSNPSEMYFWGYVYEGDLWIESHNSKNYTHKISQAAFVIAEEIGKQFLCARAPGFEGIWGIGFFRSGNEAHVLMPNGPNSYYRASDVLCFEESCSSTTFDPVNEWCYCDGTQSTFFYIEPVVMRALQSLDNQLFGIYLETEVSNFTKLVQGRITYNAGISFLGDSAINNNPFYDINSIHAIVDSNANDEFWNIPITSMQVFCSSSDSSSRSNNTNDYGIKWMKSYCLKYSCILDSGKLTFVQDCLLLLPKNRSYNGKYLVVLHISGTPKLVLPQSIVDQIKSCSTADLVDSSTGTSSSLNIQMVGGTLQINLIDLQLLYADGWIKKSDSYGGMVILGFPIWLWYYIVFDYGEGIEGKAKLSFAFYP
jgi:hypothetical protein